jgi:uncharacterized metal-binding protein
MKEKMVKPDITAKIEEDACSCEADYTIILPCSGSANCGQISNTVAIELDKQKVGKLYCLAGVELHPYLSLEGKNNR